MRSRCHRGAGLAFLILASSFSIAGTPADGPQLQSGSEALDLLATEREKDLFSGLRSDFERETFYRQFWQARDPFPQTSRNELREEWEVRLAQVGERWGRLEDDRSRAFLLRGEPSSRFESHCPTSGSFEIWIYEPGFREKHRMVLVFQPGEGVAWRLWQPGSSPNLATAAAEPCSNRERLDQEAWRIQRMGQDRYRVLIERALSRPRSREWISSFRPVAMEAPEGAPRLDADLEIEYPGLQGDKVVVRVLMLVPARALQAETRLEGPELSVAGEVLRGGEPFETFLYRLHGRRIGESVLLVFERCLAPGNYVLRVRLEHAASGSILVTERNLPVPPIRMASLGRAAPEPAAGSPEVARALAEADAALSARRPKLRLLLPSQSLLVGNVRFPARVEQAPEIPPGERIERVTFTVDGKPVLTRNHPPFDLSLDLGPVPRPRKLRAEGIGGNGGVVAHDELLINAGMQDFRVRLLEPRPGRQYRRSLRALAEVTPPAGMAVERVELWFGEDRIATLYQPPYSQPFVLPREGEAGYLRAVAFLAGGGSTEDVVFINTPVEPDKIDVRMVELYATVLDDQGKLLTGGLGSGAFAVMEDGVRQQIRQVEPVGDSPVRVVTLIDSSSSMAAQMGPARQAAAGFLRSLLRPQDQAAVIAFTEAPQVTVPLTNDRDQLEEGLRRILAEGNTSLYDSLVYSLLYLSEAKGQRAVLLLSDGLDCTSRLTFEQTLEVLRRSGIAVYAIGLGLPDGARGEAGKTLNRLAEVSGGRSFFAQDASDLASVYTQIEQELRARYRIAYQSSHTETDGAFRTVELQMTKPGIEVRTISGYYP